MAFRISLQFQF